MKVRIGILVLLLVLLGAGIASAAPSHLVDLHLFHPLATSPDPETATNVRLSLLWGRSGTVKAVDLGLTATGTGGDVKGVQWSTFYAGVDGDLKGVGISLGLHRVGGNVRGAQSGLTASWTEGFLTGVQFSALYAYTGHGLRGVQLSGLMNTNDGHGRWVQLSGAVNVNVGHFKGFQVASFVNHVNHDLTGGQIGVLNHADQGRGIQLGVVNLARDFSGFRLGIVNSSRTMRGLPVGLVNLTEGNPRHWLLYTSNVMSANLGFRTVVNGWVSTVVAGFHEVDAAREQAGSLGWHFGRRIWGDERRNLAVDLGFHHVMPSIPEELKDTGLSNHSLTQLRLTVDWAVSDRVSLHGAVGTNAARSSYEDDAETEDSGLAALGMVLR
ncbi:MAG: hypothetical protein GY838_03620 [bacterium]|nr:hypothetical protein [bacterium]